jgi:hypothetical protein
MLYLFFKLIKKLKSGYTHVQDRKPTDLVFFIGYTHILKKWKWVHIVYPRVPSTTPLLLSMVHLLNINFIFISDIYIYINLNFTEITSRNNENTHSYNFIRTEDYILYKNLYIFLYVILCILY